MITQEELRERFDYDSSGVLVWRVVDGTRAEEGRIAGRNSFDIRGYRRVWFKGKGYLASHLVFLWHHGYMPKEIDHRDRNPKNDRIENLREASREQNLWNVKRKNRSGFKGVFFRPDRGKYWATICISGKQTHLGVFSSAEEAAVAYDKAARKYFGEFATCNFDEDSNE